MKMIMYSTGGAYIREDFIKSVRPVHSGSRILTTDDREYPSDMLPQKIIDQMTQGGVNGN